MGQEGVVFVTAAAALGEAWRALSPAAIALGLALGVVNVFLFFPLLIRFLPGLRRIGWIHRRPISDIPGVPENYDVAVISAIMTLPDPNNFLTAYSFVPLQDGVAFTCTMPKCRYYSVSLYAGLFDPVQDKIPPSLTDHEIAHNADGSFDVVISATRPEDGEKGARNWLPSQGVRDGLLVIRRYGVLPGQAVECPALRRRSDGALLKPAHRSYSGSHYAEAHGNHRFARLVRVLRATALAHLALALGSPLPLPAVNAVAALGALLPVAVNALMYRVGRRRARAMVAAKADLGLHRAIEPKLDFDATSARPHPGHRYYLINFDARANDVAIAGSVEPRRQKFWDLCVYDEGGLPHFQCFTDETVVFSRERATGDEGRGYRVVLTRDPALWAGEPNVVDVSGQPRGVVLVRVVYPESEASFQRCKPGVQVLPRRFAGAGAGAKAGGKATGKAE